MEVGWAAPAKGGVASWLRGTSFTGLVGPALSLLLGSGPGMSCIECVCARKLFDQYDHFLILWHAQPRPAIFYYSYLSFPIPIRFSKV